MLKIDGIDVFYGEVQALYDISLHVKKGEIVTILGSNGAGKTTTIKTICGLNKITKGTITYEDERIDTMPAHKVAKLGIAMVPEGRKLFPTMTVKENLLLGAYSVESKDEIAEVYEWVLELFPRLAERLSQLAGTMSGGEQQMCAIGRALMSKPRFLLMDEPSLGLAPVIVDQIFDTIQHISTDSDTTILIVEQNAYMALQVADRGYVLENGKMVIENKADALLESDEIKKAYLGL